MNFTWKITDIQAEGDLIVLAKYLCSATDGTNTVETEGYWSFVEPKLVTPFAEVTEEMVANWVENESTQFGENIIKSRLAEQLTALANQKTSVAPWLPQTFTPTV